MYAKWALTPRSLNVKLGPRRNYHEGRVAIRHYANRTACPFSVLNVKALVGAFNQEKALVGAFSVIVQLHRLIDLRHYSGLCFIDICCSLEAGGCGAAARLGSLSAG